MTYRGEMDGHNALGAFLRARRGQLQPEQVGLAGGGRRRTPGLRREEVATLAGISSDYYLRLEQGRGRSPSIQVLEALARVLLLDPAETTYLLSLVAPRARRPSRPKAERVPKGVLLLLESLSLPAFVLNRYRDVLAANRLAVALSPNMRPGVNRLRAAFLDPAERELNENWEQATASAVGQLRSTMGAEADDPRVVALIGELSMKSEHFRRLWAQQSVVASSGGPATLHHPEVGEMQLYREKLEIAGAEGQVLVIYHAEPSSRSAESLALLGSLAATAGAEVSSEEGVPGAATDH